jgi:hypothetical protein
LAAEGELAVFHGVTQVYSCPECVIRPMSGLCAGMELPLMFVLGPDGEPYDPADPDGRIDLTQYQ